MSISIIGAGQVGMALGQALIRQGESVCFGVPDPGKYQAAVQALGARARGMAITSAIDASDIVVLAVPHSAAAGVAQAVPDWQGKVLVDATNPLAAGLAGLTVGTTTSGAELLAQQATGARVVKAFNSTGAENLADATYPQGAPMMPVCGDDAAARAQVMALATLIGFDAVDCGPLSAARYLEPWAMTWIHLALKQGLGRRFAFSLMRRS